MSIGDSMTSTIPPVGTAGTGYATQIDAFLTEVKGRLESLIPFSSLLIGSLDMQNNEVQQVKSLELYDQPVLPADVGTLQSYGGDLYWVSTGGAVQLTLGNSLNAASLGGITGDYGGSNPAQWRFDDADQTFYGYDDFAGSKWAHVQSRDIRLTGAYSGSARLTITWAPSASYTVTFMTAPPASTSVVLMSNAGALSATNTLPSSITAPDFLFSAQRTASLGGSVGKADSSGSPPSFSASTNVWTHGTATGRIVFQLPLLAGDRILAWTAYVTKTSATGTLSAELYEYTLASGARTKIGSTQSTSANAPGDTTLGQSSLTTVVSSAKSYFVVVIPSGTTGDFTNAVSVNYDRP